MKKIIPYLVWPLLAAPGLYLLIAWKKMPEKVALHFNLKGEADRMGDKNELITAIIVLTVTNLVVYLLLTNIWRIDPKKYAAENRYRINSIAFATVVLISAITCMMIYSGVSGQLSFKTGVIFSLVGLFFAIIGNYLPNLKPNYFAGLRLPWTLESEDNWRKTHQLAGKLWFAGGLFLAAVSLFLPPVAGMVVFFTVTTVITLIPCIFSFRLYRQTKK